MKEKRIALIPIYKPNKNFITLTRRVKEEGFLIVAVNDGSGQEYNPIFEETKKYAIVLEYEKNQGKGEALKTGLRYIQKEIEAPYTVVCVDGDGQHALEDVNAVANISQNNPKSLVLGSRHFEGKVPLRSRFGNRLTSLVFTLSSGKKLMDTQTGLRAFSNQLVDSLLKIKGSRYEYEMNVLMEMVRNQVDIIENPIQTVYIEENKESHFHVIRDSIKIYKEILKFSLSSLISFLIDYLMFISLSSLGISLFLSNVIARIFSSLTNFTLNRNYVFKDGTNFLESAIKYFTLAIVILIFNTILLSIFVRIGMQKYVAKIMVECFLFIVNYFIQQQFVFPKKVTV